MVDKTPNLDDLRFQKDLVDEARKRLVQYCPEWTEFNLSDPGVTLIELFAWMTENTIYRLNRVPEKNYLKFLEMSGVTPLPASSATAKLTFYLSTPFPVNLGEDIATTLPQGLEVTTGPTENEDGITFTLEKDVLILPPLLTDLRTSKDGYAANYLSDNMESTDRMGGEKLAIFSHGDFNEKGDLIPDPEGKFVLRFADTREMAGCVLQLAFKCDEAKGAGINRENPPWLWECLMGEDEAGKEKWEAVRVSSQRGEKDTTGGLNNERGALVLHLPLHFRPARFRGKGVETARSWGYWVRCSLVAPKEGQKMYDTSPVVSSVEAYSLGVTALTSQSTVVREEKLGVSSGDAGQIFRLEHFPILGPSEEEVVEVEERREGRIEFMPWQRVTDFANSKRDDRHYTLDPSTGEVQFGPGIRQPDGSAQQYGRVPEVGRGIRISHYRFGGGSQGNVPPGKIRLMRSAVPFVDRVTNYEAASGGRDLEELEEMKMRARREMRSQKRAVTTEDFETLGKASLPDKIARVKCVSGQEGEVRLLVVPSGGGEITAAKLARLTLSKELEIEIRNRMDSARLLTTRLVVAEPEFYGVKVEAEIAVDRRGQEETVRERVNRLLKMYLSPLAPETKDWRAHAREDLKLNDQEEMPDEWLRPEWQGWPFGRSLYPSDLYAFIQKIRGVRNVLNVYIYRAKAIRPGAWNEDWLKKPAEVESIISAEDEADKGRTIVSLDHDIKIR